MIFLFYLFQTFLALSSLSVGVCIFSILVGITPSLIQFYLLELISLPGIILYSTWNNKLLILFKYLIIPLFLMILMLKIAYFFISYSLDILF